jgi:cell wall assembly regulator SMI1
LGGLAVVDEAQFKVQLDRLERVWRRLDSPLVDLLRPGLSDEQIDELMAPTGLTLPDELRLWWGWHDGAPTTSDQEEGRGLGSGGWLHVSPSEAIDLYNYHEGFYREMIAIPLAPVTLRATA